MLANKYNTQNFIPESNYMAIYDTDAESYDEWYSTSIGRFIDDIQSNMVFEQLEPKQNMHILDVGCGTGNQSIKLAKLGCKVTGIDISEKMLDQAIHKKEGLSIEFIQMEANSLNFPDNYFDAIISVTAFEFIKNINQAFVEMLRVAKNGAPIVIGTLNKESNWGKLYSSKKFKNDTIFKYASLRNKTDFEKLSPEKLIHINECLFINPAEKEENYTLKNEYKQSLLNNGGFICALWKK